MAETAAWTDVDGSAREGALTNIAITAAELGWLDRAATIAALLVETGNRDWAWSTIAHAATAAGRFAVADDAATQITAGGERAQAHLDIARARDDAAGYRRALAAALATDDTYYRIDALVTIADRLPGGVDGPALE